MLLKIEWKLNLLMMRRYTRQDAFVKQRVADVKVFIFDDERYN